MIDNSGYVPRQVQLTVDLLKNRTRQYIFISTISVYADLSQSGIKEDAPRKVLADPHIEEVTGATLGGLKAACERIVENGFGPRGTILRSVYIVGPGDPEGLFTYWIARTSRGGKVLAPGTFARHLNRLPADQPTRIVGLSSERETELLDLWRTAN